FRSLISPGDGAYSPAPGSKCRETLYHPWSRGSLESAYAFLSRFARLWYNQLSVRQSPGALAAKECHCSIRCVLVKLPSYSAIWVEGKKKTSVLMSLILTSPLFTSGARYQYVAVSVSQLSFTTTQSSCRSARRVAPPLSEVAGFCPTQHIALTLPSAMAAKLAMWEWSPRIFGCQS